MRIGINTRFLLSSKMEGFGWFTFEVVKRIVEAHPEHEFVFFFDRAFDQKFIFASNVKPVVLFPPARSATLIMAWFECALPRALKREKIDLFFSPDGFLSLRSKCKQIGVIHDLNFIHYPQDLPLRYRIYYRFFFKRFAQKAVHLLTVSQCSKNDIVQTYQIPADKITVAWNGVSEAYVPLDPIEIAVTRDAYTNGVPYFIFVGALHPRKNLKSLLQAFELFKKNGGKETLLIVGESLFSGNTDYKNLISEETFREIHFTGYLSQNELTKVMASALSLVFIPYFEGFGIPLVEAMKCGIPIISGNLTSLPEIVDDAAILVDPFDTNEIAQQMQNMAEDVGLRNELSEKGLKRSRFFNWDFTADKVWNVIEENL